MSRLSRGDRARRLSRPLGPMETILEQDQFCRMAMNQTG